MRPLTDLFGASQFSDRPARRHRGAPRRRFRWPWALRPFFPKRRRRPGLVGPGVRRSRRSRRWPGRSAPTRSSRCPAEVVARRSVLLWLGGHDRGPDAGPPGSSARSPRSPGRWCSPGENDGPAGRLGPGADRASATVVIGATAADLDRRTARYGLGPLLLVHHGAAGSTSPSPTPSSCARSSASRCRSCSSPGPTPRRRSARAVRTPRSGSCSGSCRSTGIGRAGLDRRRGRRVRAARTASRSGARSPRELEPRMRAPPVPDRATRASIVVVRAGRARRSTPPGSQGWPTTASTRVAAADPGHRGVDRVRRVPRDPRTPAAPAPPRSGAPPVGSLGVRARGRNGNGTAGHQRPRPTARAELSAGVRRSRAAEEAAGRGERRRSRRRVTPR